MLDITSVIGMFDLKHGDHVADLGSGIGHFSIPIAKRVGPEGKVYAVDIHRDILTRLSHDASEHHISNIHAIWGDIENPGGTHIDSGTMDVVLCINILFQIPDRPSALREILRIIKKGGRIIVVDWHSDTLLGPRKEKRVPLDEVKRLCERFGLLFVKDISVGAHHYGIIFKKE